MISDKELKKKKAERESKFVEEFTKHGFNKIQIEPDGNCAFRAVCIIF